MQLSLSKSSALYFFFVFLLPRTAFSQTKEKNQRKGEFYFSWGYNTEWYTNSTIHISQPSLKNEYSFESIEAHDHRGWDEGLLEKQLTIPQYNYRVGYFFNKSKNLAVEINFDHTKYIVTEGQKAHIKGKMNEQYIDQYIVFAGDSGFYYFLNNGANFLLFNIVKRWNWVESKSAKKNFKLDFLAKAGIGPVIPHVQNVFFGQSNTPQFQLGGWNIGIEGAIRATFYKYVYLEYTNKLDYARYSGLKIYEGTARQAFGTYEMVLNLGVTFPVGKKTEETK